MRWLVVLALVVVSACSEGRPLPYWTVDGHTAPLPTLLASVGDGDFTLRTAWRVPLDLHGHDLTLVFPFFQGPLAATADGVPLVEHGDAGVGEHRFAIPAAATAREVLKLAVSARRDADSSVYGFGAAPEIVDGVDTVAGGRAQFARAAATSATAVLVMIALFAGALFAFDRRNRGEAVLALQAIAGVPYALWFLGLAPGAALVSLAVFGFAQLFFLHVAFELGPPRRWMSGCWLATIILAALAGFGVVASELAIAMVLSMAVGHLGYLLWWLRPMLRRSKRRVEARIFLLVLCGVIVTGLVIAVETSGGVHTLPLLVACLAAGQLVISASKLVATRRELEAVNARWNQRHAAQLAKQKEKTTPPAKTTRVVNGRYLVIKPLGEGGAASTVHEVERLSDKQHFAMKQLRGRAEPGSLVHLLRESEVHHPNLMPVVDLGLGDERMALVMPLVDGGSLEQHADKFGNVAWAQSMLAQIASGLAALHARGIVHRDLKLSNVLIDHDVARLANFGFAVDAPDAQPASDMFALGLIAFELIHGRAAFVEPPVYGRKRDAPIEMPSLDRLDPIFARCLDLDPTQRPAATEVVDALSN